MRTVRRLTASIIKGAVKPGLYGDGLGLYLQVSTYGTKSWLFRFMLEGVARKMGLGPEHTVTLARARRLAKKARLMLLDRVDPISARKSAKALQVAKGL